MITHTELRNDLAWANINPDLKNKLLTYIEKQEKKDIQYEQLKTEINIFIVGIESKLKRFREELK